jgi:prevent-host-death family protein
MKFSEQVKPISYLKAHAADIIKDFEHNHEPLIITQNGEAKMVVMDIRTYETQLENLAFLKLIKLGEKQIAEGRFQDVDAFFAEVDREE